MRVVDVVFVILVYRNADDLVDFIESIKKNINSYGLVIVNSYYDNESLKKVRTITENYGGVFHNIENRGYSYGNNEGIRVAIDIFEFDYLIVANPDMKIINFDLAGLKDCVCVAGPIIKTNTNKNQNPYRVMRIPIMEHLNYYAYKKGLYKLVYGYIVINKLIRDVYLVCFRKFGKKINRVHALHGSFLIFTNQYLKENKSPFCDKMFLFGEEDYLAYRNCKNGIPMYLMRDTEVFHKEDGSMKLSSVDQWEEAAKSYIAYINNRDIDDVIL